MFDATTSAGFVPWGISRVGVGVKSNFSPANARPPALAQG